MATNKLKSLQVSKARTPGYLADGGGLFLQVTKTADDTIRRSWVVRFRAGTGKMREMGLGSADTIPLSDARELAQEARKLAAKGIDPIEAKRAARVQARTRKHALTFKQAAEAYVDSHESGWKNEKHRQQWRNSLATYVYPEFGETPVADVDRAALLRAIDPIWKTKTETASRVKNRVVTILEWAVARGYRADGDLGAWRNYLRKALQHRPKSQRVQHHPAMPYSEVAAFMRDLREREGASARALELVILTAVRTNEGLRAKWSEFDLKKAIWTIPAERMKAGREHRVPLSKRAVEILRELKKRSSSDWVFPGRGDEPLSNMSLLMTLRRMGREDVTTHGFRSSFRDWAAEETHFAREVVEKALAHMITNQTEAAYWRGDVLDKRRELMQSWCDFCASEAARAK